MEKTLDMYLEDINALVNTFLVTEIDDDYCAVMGTDFEARNDENCIVWSAIYSDRGGEAFRNDFIKRFPVAKDLDTFTLSVLHEIGHLETEDEMVDDTKQRNRKNLTNEQYFRLHNEYIATEWAGYWLEDNLATAKRWNAKFLKAFRTMVKNCL